MTLPSRKVLPLVAAGIFATVLTLQYPLQTTFPIGGDATRYIADAEGVIKGFGLSPAEGLKTLATNSLYPGTTMLLVVSKAIPISWPERFTWWMAAGNLAVAISVGAFAYRLGGWTAAASAIAIWPLASASITHHTESGTLAQLLSLILIPSAIAGVANKRLWVTALVLLLVFLLHPISGIVLLITVALTAACYFLYFGKNQLHIRHWSAWMIIPLGIAVVIISIIIWRIHGSFFYTITTYPVGSLPIFEYVTRPIGFFLLISPAGLAVLAHKLAGKDATLSLAVLCFAFISLLLAFNNLLGVGVFIGRLTSYLALAVTMLSGLALPWLLRTILTPAAVRIIFTVALFTSFGLAAWNETARIFRFYESPLGYARVHPEEISAIRWLESTYNEPQFILSTDTNRHSEWIPILSKHRWQALSSGDPFWQLPAAQLQPALAAKPYTHVALFKHREKPAEQFPGGVDAFPVVYENDSVIILDVNNI